MTAPHFALVLAAATMVACGSSGSPTGSTNGVAMTDQNNYTSMSTLNLPVVQTKAAADLSISWTGVMKDLLCHPAASVDNVAFLKVPNMTKDQIQTALAEGTLAASQVKSYFEWHTGGATSTMLSSLKFGGAIDVMNDYTESATTQYLLLFTHGTVQGVGAQAMVLLQPMASSANTTVAAPDACSSNVLASFVPTFGAPLDVPKAGPYTIDWSKLTKDSFGHAIQFQNIDQVEVAFYQGKQTSDLMAHFLDVEIDATSLYAAMLAAPAPKSFDLTKAKTSSGTSFPGFAQTDGTWALALRCSSCSVPAPLAFTILQPQ